MIIESFKNASYFTRLVFVFFTILSGFVIFMVLGVVIAIPLFGIDLNHFSETISSLDPGNLNLMKYLQSVYSIGLFVFPPFMIAFFFSGKIGDYLKLNKLPGIISLLIAAFTILFAVPLVNFLMEINQQVKFPEWMSGFEQTMKQFENEADKTTSLFLQTSSFSVYLVNIVVLGLIPAIGEELLFRGIFQRLFQEWTKNIHWGIWIAAFLFSAMHMQFYGLLPRMVLGAFLGYLFYWSQSMWVPMFAHFLNNAFAVTFYYINGDVAKEAETIGTGSGALTQVLLSTILAGALIFTFYKIEKERNKKDSEIKLIDNE